MIYVITRNSYDGLKFWTDRGRWVAEYPDATEYHSYRDARDAYRKARENDQHPSDIDAVRNYGLDTEETLFYGEEV